MNRILLIILLVSVGTAMWAQPRKEKVNAARIAYITEELSLTPDEAEQFWPIYNELRREMEVLRKKNRRLRNKVTTTDAEAEQLLLDVFANDEKLVAIQKEYYWKLKKVISAQRILKLKNIERDFKKMLLEHIQGRRGG